MVLGCQRARYQPDVHVTSLPGGGAVWKDKETESATRVAVERSLS